MARFLMNFAKLTLLVRHATAQDYSSFPSTCSSDCRNFVENAALCKAEYQASTKNTSTLTCFCSGMDDIDFQSCSTCLKDSRASSMPLVDDLQMSCKNNFTNGCVYQCDFRTCQDTDIFCKCTKPYLQDLYNCASCHTNLGLGEVPQIKDYSDIVRSCLDQDLVGPGDLAKSTEPLPSPTGQASYQAPSLTEGGALTATPPAGGRASVTLAATVEIPTKTEIATAFDIATFSGSPSVVPNPSIAPSQSGNGRCNQDMGFYSSLVTMMAVLLFLPI